MTVTTILNTGCRGGATAAPGTPATAYLICTLPRSGSTLLAQGLRHTTVAGHPEEYFWVAMRGEFSRRWQLPEDASDEAFLERVRVAGSTSNGVFAAKVHWPQFTRFERMLSKRSPASGGDDDPERQESAPLPSHARVEEFLPGVRYVHLTRRDKTAQAISLYRAVTSGVWLRRHGDIDPPGYDGIPLDQQAVEQLERQLRENDWCWVDYFARSRIEPLTITYEELAADYTGTIRRVLAFLGRPEADTVDIKQPALRRQSDGRSSGMRREVVERRARRVTRRHAGLPSASVVVVTHNEGENLRRTVDAFTATMPDSVELVVVDDWSTDGSIQSIADNERVRVVSPPVRAGVAGARNFGAAHTSGDVVIFSDAHVDPAPGWLRPLCAVFADPAVAAAAPTVSQIAQRSTKGYGFTWRDAALSVRWLRQRPASPAPVPFLCGCFMAFRRADFEAVEGFDAGMVTWGSEDAEICLNLWRRGRRCVVVPGSDITHLFRPSFPYQVRMRETLHNTLRLATVHLPDRALEAVVARASRLVAFPAAYADLLESDAWQRRERIHSASKRDGGWFLGRFGISLLPEGGAT
jgi:LPS sulfotransferase NodH/GT2 family glycosyltransferase